MIGDTGPSGRNAIDGVEFTNTLNKIKIMDHNNSIIKELSIESTIHKDIRQYAVEMEKKKLQQMIKDGTIDW